MMHRLPTLLKHIIKLKNSFLFIVSIIMKIFMNINIPILIILLFH